VHMQPDTPPDPDVLPEQPRASRGPFTGRRMLWIGSGALVVVVGALLIWPSAPRRTPMATSTERFDGPALVLVERGDFDMVIPVSGELSALRQVEVRNLLEGRAVITEIVAEGKRVAKGDMLVRFASEETADRNKDLQDKLKTAQTEAISAEQALAIKRNEKASEMDKARLQVQLAELALEGWRSGDQVSKRQQLATALEAATIDAQRLQKRFAESESLVAKGFISRDEFERDRIAMIQADAKMKQSALDIDVYEKFQRPQDEAKRKSDLDQATAELGRTEQRKDSEIVKATSDLESAQFRAKTAQERLEQGQRQLENTTIRSPTDGLVVYASSLESGGWGRGGSESSPPTAGTEVKPNELIMIIPDTSQMVASLKVSEALSGRIKPDQEVTVFSDANPNVPIVGTVLNVSVLAESGGWRDPNRRDYKVRVLLDDSHGLDLKPSMRCKASILLGRAEDVLSIPVQAVFREGVASYVYVPDGKGFSQRQVRLGRSSELQVEVVDGLGEGDEVLLREPSADEIVVRLPPEVVNPKEDQPARQRGAQLPTPAETPATPVTPAPTSQPSSGS